MACLAILLALPVLLCAQVQEEAHVLDGAGGGAGGASLSNRFSACQIGPVGDSSSGSFMNRAGFYSSFLLHPLLDTDADGITDEDDPDDDNDTLSDLAELSGQSFEPQTRTDSLLTDSDGDGMSDGEEAGAGTNPQDGNSLLQLTRVDLEGASVVLTWTSRDGYTYHLSMAGSVTGLTAHGTVVDTVTASGGVGPWWETESKSTNAIAPGAQFYRVSVDE